MHAVNRPTPEIFADLWRLLREYGVNESNFQKIADVFQPLELRKGETFCEIGKRTDSLGILLSGLLIAKYEKVNSANAIISRFYYPPRNIIVVSFESFYSGKKCNETIQAIEYSYLFTISRDKLNDLYNEVPEMNKIGRLMAERSYILALQRCHQLQAMSIKERVDDFYDFHSEIATRVQNQHVCSYIGTNRNTLARLQRKKKK